MSYFKLSMGQHQTFLRKPTLFQHIGLKSSFDITKDNPLKDRYFDSGSKPIVGDNPPATVLSTMPCHAGDEPEMAYSSGTGFFWATRVMAHDSIFVLFEDPVVLRRVLVHTGSPASPGDILGAGSLLVSDAVSHFDVTNRTARCDNLVSVGQFFNATIDVDKLDERVKKATKCLVVRVDETEKHWVVFSQIAVFVVK